MKSSTIVLIAILLIALVFGGSIIVNFIEQARNALGGGAESNLSGTAGLGAIVYFSDGTQQEVKPSPMSLLPLTVYYYGKQCDGFSFQLYGSVTYSGSPSTFTTESNIEILIGQTSHKKEASTQTKTPTSGQSWFIQKLDLTDDEIETYGEGTRTITVKAFAKITVAWTGQTETKQANSELNVEVSITKSSTTPTTYTIQAFSITTKTIDFTQPPGT